MHGLHLLFQQIDKIRKMLIIVRERLQKRLARGVIAIPGAANH